MTKGERREIKRFYKRLMEARDSIARKIFEDIVTQMRPELEKELKAMKTDRQLEYEDFINVNYFTFEQTYGQCHAAAREMQQHFPELRLVFGHVFTEAWGKRQHAWLETPDGLIVDPTAMQFPDIQRYEEWKPGDLLAVGKCVNCGREIEEPVADLNTFEVKSICSDACADAYVEYINNNGQK